MTTLNQQFCAGLVNAIRPDVEKAGFKTHREMSVMKFNSKNNPRFFCEFRGTLKDGTEMRWCDDIYTDSASDARYQAWNAVLAKLGVEGYEYV